MGLCGGGGVFSSLFISFKRDINLINVCSFKWFKTYSTPVVVWWNNVKVSVKMFKMVLFRFRFEWLMGDTEVRENTERIILTSYTSTKFWVLQTNALSDRVLVLPATIDHHVLCKSLYFFSCERDCWQDLYIVCRVLYLSYFETKV